MKYEVISRREAMEKSTRPKLSIIDQCVQGKAMNVPDIIRATNRGIIANGDLFRKLPDDKDEVLTEHDGWSDGNDYLDLAVAGQRKAEMKEKALADHEKTQKKLKKSAEKSSEASKGGQNDIDE